jgi:hypothetical protein
MFFLGVGFVVVLGIALGAIVGGLVVRLEALCGSGNLTFDVIWDV